MNAIEERRLAAALRILVAASRELSASFEYAETLAAVGRLIVPEYARGFAVDVDEGESPTAVARVGSCEDDGRTIPLVARERVLGTMVVSGAEIDRAGEIDLWDELALRIAVAIDSAQIYAREHHVADTLQRALLPDRLPLDSRLRFDAAYRPGAEESIVGGDWYDAFRLPDGRIAFSIGDVAGHGLRAAIVMGEVRQAFRAAALNPNSPSLVLERANTILNMRSNPVMVTAVFGIIDPRENTLTYASAGHPAPVLALPCGTTQVLPKDGLPLGIVDRVDATDWTVTLAPGALLTLYTDGLIEYSRDVLDGELRLLEAVHAGVADPAEHPANAVLDRIFTTVKNSDDVAALTVLVEDEASPHFVFNFTALPVAVPLVRRALKRYLEKLGCDDDHQFALLTASGEAIANAVEHAYGGPPGIVRVVADADHEQIVLTVEDEGKWKPAVRREERGRGLPLMRALMDAVEIRTHIARTEVRLTLMLRERRASA